MSDLTLPEKIIFVDGITGEIREEVDFEEVPLSIRIADSKEGIATPVVKIVDITDGNTRTIKQYGAGDELLRTTYQRSEN